MPDTTLWWIALGAGLAVAVVAWILLHALLRAVRRIEEEVQAVWETAARAAANTATTWMLERTDDLAGTLASTLRAEMSPHGEALQE